MSLRSSLATAALTRFAVPPFAPAPDDPRVADKANVLQLLDLTEKLVEYDSSNADFSGQTPTLQDKAYVRYELFGPDGGLVGRTRGVGQMLYKNDDGHFIAWFSEEITLLDGTVVRTGGLVDDAKLTEGQQATIPAVGIAGAFRGAVGFRQFRPVVPHEQYESAIVLYRR